MLERERPEAQAAEEAHQADQHRSEERLADHFALEHLAVADKPQKAPEPHIAHHDETADTVAHRQRDGKRQHGQGKRIDARRLTEQQQADEERHDEDGESDTRSGE